MTRIDAGRGTDPYAQTSGSQNSTSRASTGDAGKRGGLGGGLGSGLGSGLGGDHGSSGLDAGLSRFGTARSHAESGFDTRRDFREEAGGHQDREALFASRLKHALTPDEDGQKDQGNKGGDASDAAASRQLLATAMPADAVPSADGADIGPGTRQMRAETIAARVHAAIDAAERPLPGAPLVLNLQMPELADAGIAGLAIVLTGSELEITLTPMAGLQAGIVPDGLREAAQALADRLGRRFPSRRIRVFEADVAETVSAKAETGAMSQLSALLSR